MGCEVEMEKNNSIVPQIMVKQSCFEPYPNWNQDMTTLEHKY
jgi:hypothetical protein